MLKSILIGVLALTGLSTAVAQSNEQLDALLAQAPARLDSVSYLALVAGGLVAEDVTPGAAYEAALAAGFVDKAKRPDDSVSIEELSYLLMKALKVGGGLQWTILPNPRAAYQELVYRKIANGSAGPLRVVAGDEVVRTLDAVMVLKGGRK